MCSTGAKVASSNDSAVRTPVPVMMNAIAFPDVQPTGSRPIRLAQCEGLTSRSMYRPHAAISAAVGPSRSQSRCPMVHQRCPSLHGPGAGGVPPETKHGGGECQQDNEEGELQGPVLAGRVVGNAVNLAGLHDPSA